jgi:hypothetical protein
MKQIEYYCGHHFDPTKAKDMLALDWLQAKIKAAQLTIEDLLFVDYLHRDNARIGKISKAMKHWQQLASEIQGVDHASMG